MVTDDGDGLDRVLENVKRAFETGLTHPDTKVAVDAAHTFMGMFYRPEVIKDADEA